MYAIAKHDNSPAVYRRIFRSFCLVVFFCAFALSLASELALDLLFPPSYRSATSIIPVVAASSVLYGIYSIFMLIGINVRRKSWYVTVYVAIAAVLNVALNLILIPRAGAMGAALSTLLAYFVLAALAYVGNQRIYPIPFEIGRVTLAAILGVALYAGSGLAVAAIAPVPAWPIQLLALAVYGAALIGVERYHTVRGGGALSHR
jgi:O-antigen/teichoic acid export membrane protein